MSELIPATCLAIATIYGEAAGEPYAGKLAVAEVIRNRMKTRHQSDGSVAGTVLKPWQFSLWNTDGTGRIRACKAGEGSVAGQECRRAWEESEQSNTVQGALYYFADYIHPPSWAAGMEHIRKIGRHLFYKPKG